MRRVVTAGRLRRRLAITFALVVAVSTGALAVGTYVAVRAARLDDAADHSLALARTNLVLAGSLLAGSSDPRDVADLRELYARRPGLETVALVGDTELRSRFGREQISDGLRRLVRNGDLAYERREIGGTPYFVAGGRPTPSRAELYFFFSEAALHDDLAQLRDILLVGWAIVVLLSAAAGALAARRVLRPVGQASEAAHALAEGLLETRLPVETDDELGAWAASFNEMADALEDKIRALSAAQARERRFTADVAHELRTPLTALAAEAALLEQHLDRMPSEAKRPAELLVADVGRLQRLVEELMEISRLDAGRGDVRLEPVELGRLASGLVRSRGWAASVSGAALVETDPRRAERILSNLLENAVAHGGRDVAVQVGRHDGVAFVEVRDAGPGIAVEQLPHVFERFYKADPSRAGGGSGLGLAIALQNARLLGGDIDAWSEAGAGSRFTLRLPVAESLRGGGPEAAGESDDGRR
jgi:two-component system, OmpR family, sensor histidine kinase MtrB